MRMCDRDETFTSGCIELKLYFMEMDVESKPTLVAFSEATVMRACVRARTARGGVRRAYRQQ